MSISVTAIVIVAIITSAVVRLARIRAGTDRIGNRHMPAQPLLDHGQPSAHELELQREVEALRERIKVLERIATDERRPQALAAEIESLRNQ